MASPSPSPDFPASHAPTLEGVPQGRRPDGAELTPAEIRAMARRGWVAYRVSTAPPAGRGADKRESQRRRSRLRSAKLLDSNNRFLCECLVYDYSSTGLRLRLMKNVGLPKSCAIFDDETAAVSAVAIVWRRDSAVGMRFRPNGRPAPLSKSAWTALRGRYYAMTD